MRWSSRQQNTQKTNYANQALCYKALKRANIPNSNLTKQQRRALRSLRRDKDIVILPAVKGNTTVVLDRSEYDEMRALIDTPTYRKLTKDPATTQETKVLKILRKLKSKGAVIGREYKAMRPSASYFLIIYGLPKVYKERTFRSGPLYPVLVLQPIAWPNNACFPSLGL